MLLYTTLSGGGLATVCTNDATVGVIHTLRHISTTPADGAYIGAFRFYGRNDVGEDTLYCAIEALSRDVSENTEDGEFNFPITAAGVWAAKIFKMLPTGAMRVPNSLEIGLTKVIGARVIDARCDDVVDNTYGAEEAGVLDALRDAMIAHGLIAAS